MLHWLVFTPIISAVVFYLIPSEKAGKILSIIVQAFLTCCTFYIFLLCKEGDIITKVGDYHGHLGITLKVDSLSSVFIILTSFIFSIAALYCFNENYGRLFWFLLLIWEGLLFGVFVSRDFFNTFIIMEVITVMVSIMIMYKRDNRSMYDGIIYLMSNVVAVQFYLFGVGYIYKITGVLNIDAASQSLSALDKGSQLLPYALIMTFISLKCALMPLFSWLPKAHGTPSAPPVISAILSGLHIKTGLYVFIRFQSVFQAINLNEFFLVVGIITGIAGFIFAISQTDIKLILAYHTISQIGMTMIGLNIPGVYSYTGSMYHIISHAFFKSGLFFSAGIVAHAYGTRDLYKIRGVLRRNPTVGIGIIMAVLGITGAPFFNGSISKYFIVSNANWIVNGAMIFINLGTTISFIKFSTMLFGKYDGDQGHIKVDICQQAAVLIMGILCLAGGIFWEQSIKFLFNTSVKVDTAGYFQKTVLFFISVAVGYLIFKFYIKKSKLLKRIRAIELGFREICICIGLFFALIMLYGWITLAV